MAFALCCFWLLVTRFKATRNEIQNLSFWCGWACLVVLFRPDCEKFYRNTSRPRWLDGLSINVSKIMKTCQNVEPVIFLIESKWSIFVHSAWNATFRKANNELPHRLESCFRGKKCTVNGDMQHDSSAVLSRMRLTAQGSDFLSNKQIKPQICCLRTLTGAIHFQSDIQADRTSNHNELFTRRSFCAAATTPGYLPRCWNNYDSCSGVLSLGWRAVAEMLVLPSGGTLLEVIIVSDVAEWDGGSPTE